MATFEKITTVEVGSGGASSIDFTSIPSTFTDLCLLLSLRSGNSGLIYADTRIRFNSSGSDTNHSGRYLEGSGSAASSYSLAYVYAPMDGSAATASTFANTQIYIPNYTASTAKPISIDTVLENNATTAYASLGAGLYNSSSAISSIYVINSSGNIAQYSSATLYGIKKA